jgi:hypothetical protein
MTPEMSGFECTRGNPAGSGFQANCPTLSSQDLLWPYGQTPTNDRTIQRWQRSRLRRLRSLDKHGNGSADDHGGREYGNQIYP